VTIKTKFVFLILVVNIVLAVLILAEDLRSVKLSGIEKEKMLLEDIRDSLNKEDAALVDLLIGPFEQSIENYKNAAEKTEETFKTAEKNIKILPQLNKSIKDSLDILYNLNSLNSDRRSELLEKADNFWSIAVNEYTFLSGVSLYRIVSDPYFRKKDGFESVKNSIDDFISSFNIIHTTIFSSIGEVLDKEMGHILNELAKISRFQFIVMNVSIVLLITVTTFISMFILRSILKKINNIKDGISVLATGDLTVIFDSHGNDELSKLSEDINNFVSSLRESIKSIQNNSMENSSAGNNLLDAAEDTAGSVEESERNIESILELTQRLDSSVQESSESAETIVGHVENFKDMVQAQAAMVEESTAAITEMTASLDNMSKVVSSNRKSADNLGRASYTGSEKIEQTSEIINRVSNHVNAIQEMADVIKGVAEQTNLLSMNAAIEAAHAGDAGRGFGVVADEIRKLAETTGENSRVISENLKDIINDIIEATNASNQTIESFEEIDKEAKEVINSLAEMSSSITELGKGGSQIMDAMHELQNYTEKVKDSTFDISENIHSVRKAVSVASDVSGQVTSGTNEIKTGISVIRENSERNREIAGKIKRISENLDLEVRKFKISGESENAGSIENGQTEIPSDMPEITDEGVTLSPDDWPGKEEILIVEGSGKSE